jgi:hypothetical protein
MTKFCVSFDFDLTIKFKLEFYPLGRCLAQFSFETVIAASDEYQQRNRLLVSLFDQSTGGVTISH